MKELETLMTVFGYARFMMAVLGNGSNVAKIKMGTQVISELFSDIRTIQRHSGGVPISSELMKYTPTPYNGKEHINHKKLVDFQSFWRVE